jgi:dihydroflavonol-4-reductase
MSSKLTVAVTGSTGHVASAVIPLLTGAGHRVRALIRQPDPGLDSAGLETVTGNLSDPESLDRLVTGCGVVIHCAAVISLKSDRDPAIFETNVEGTRRLFDAAVRAGVRRFIHVSSIHAYDQLSADGVLDENHPYCGPKAPRYDRSKRDAQQFVLGQPAGPMEVLVVNPTAVIGPYDRKPSFIGKAVMDIYNRKFPMLISGGFDFVDVRDVAAGIVNAIHRGRGGEAYLLSGHWHSLGEVERMIAGIRGGGRRLPVLPAWTGFAGLPFVTLAARLSGQEPVITREAMLALKQGHQNISSRKAIEELGYNSRQLEETVRDTIDWFKQTGRLK